MKETMKAAALVAAAAMMMAATPIAAQAQQSQAAAPPAQAPPPVGASSEDVDGETMFATSCGFCHQGGGRVQGKGPKLAGDKHSDDYLMDRIKKGKPGAMPAFGKAFSEGQIAAIVAYIRTLEE